MYYSRKHKILENKFNTVENLAKEIYKENQEKMEFDVIDPNSPTKRIEKTLFEKVVQNVMPRKTVMCVDVFDINQKDEIMNQRCIQRESRDPELLEVDKIRKAVSPQPKITLMGFSKDAFFNKRKGILKPCLKLRKINIFANLSKNFAGYLNKNNERKVREIANESIDKRKTMMVQNQNYTNLRLKSPNSYANRKTSNEVNKQIDISDMKKKKSMMADKIILSSPFYKGRRRSRKTFENFSKVITEQEIKEYRRHILEEVNERGMSI